MRTVYFTGHHSFHNRGCEAIVRATVKLINENCSNSCIYVPSSHTAADFRQWPNADELGVHFVKFSPSSLHHRIWSKAQNLPIHTLKRIKWPFSLDSGVQKKILASDLVLSIGGDIYSLDYGIPFRLINMNQMAIDNGIPTVLWAASVGPFDSEPAFIPVIRQHLAQMAFVVVRERISQGYLEKQLDLNNVILGADPAFCLEPEEVKLDEFWPVSPSGTVLGLNMSPLIERYLAKSQAAKLQAVIAEFIRQVVHEHKLGVLLVPHVITNKIRSNDAKYVQQILDSVGDLRGHVTCMKSDLNASQTKYVISQCSLFVGARTHSTIAALSSRVPTISVAYSVKAKGINRDIFGHTKFVLDADRISSHELSRKVNMALESYADVQQTLNQQIPIIQARARKAMRMVLESI